MKLTDLIPDQQNANKGTIRGRKAVKDSLTAYGTGRSILIDKHGRIIAGNKTAESAQAAGLEYVIVVKSDGTKVIAVQRTDLGLETDPKAKAMAIADNRTAELGLKWDPAALAQLATDLDLKPFFTDAKMADILGEKVTPSDPNAEYVGMPEYSAEHQMGVRDIVIPFQSHEAVKEFAKLLCQNISEKAKYLWYPKAENADLASYKFVIEAE